MLAKFACFNLAEKISEVSLLNPAVVIYLAPLRSVIFFSISLMFVLWSIFFLTKLLKQGILFSTARRAVLVAKLVILGISLLTLFILTLRVVLVAKTVMPGIVSSIFF